MFRLLKGYMRKHVDRKAVHQKEKVGNSSKRQKGYCYCFCDKSFFPDYFKKVNRKFGNCRRALTGVKDSDKEKGTDDTFRVESLLRNQWIEAIGWSGTLALTWSLTQNFHLFARKRTAQDYVTSHRFENSSLHLCPHYILKNILLNSVSSVSAQPNDLVNVKTLLNTEEVSVPQNSLPIFGPKTADETLNEATDGMKKIRDETVGELENRLGLRCMSKQQYRKAIIHFAAGSALQNSSATFNLAQCYELGLGTRQNYERAAKCYRTASNQGNASATYNLAVFYAHGIGGLKTDRGKALKLLESAVALGEPNAKQLLERYVFNKTRMSVKKENESNKEDELKSNVQDKSCKEEAWIAEVRSSFAALKLPFGASNPIRFPVISSKVGRNTTSSSISTDDGLASEYESSNPSVESSSNSSCRSESSGGSYRDEKTSDRTSSGESSISSRGSHSHMSEFPLKIAEPRFDYPCPLLVKKCPIRKVTAAKT